VDYDCCLLVAVAVVDPRDYNEFFQEHLWKNLPLVIGATQTSHWRARREWVTAEGTPNLPVLRNLFGDCQVQAADCSTRNFNDQKREIIPFSDFIGYWERHARGEDQRILYCKDWHLVKDRPDYGAYETPEVFTDDWLNSFWDMKVVDDYRFCYLGPRGSWTPFHADVYRSYSWSTNICGRKLWTLFSPDQVPLLRDSRGDFPYDLRHVDHTKFPHFAKTRPLTLVQNPGESLFVPSCWYHQVENLVSPSLVSSLGLAPR